MTSDDLAALERKIAGDLSRRPECFITHPSEVRLLQPMEKSELRQLANRNGWRVVRRLGGRQFQFYNDTNERMLNEEGRTPVGSQSGAYYESEQRP
jgi:hypothetical protein